MKKLTQAAHGKAVKNIASLMAAADVAAQSTSSVVAYAQVGADVAKQYEFTTADLAWSAKPEERGAGCVMFCEAIEERGLKVSKQAVARFTAGAKLGEKRVTSVVTIGKKLHADNGGQGRTANMYQSMLQAAAAGSNEKEVREKGLAALTHTPESAQQEVLKGAALRDKMIEDFLKKAKKVFTDGTYENLQLAMEPVGKVRCIDRK